MIAGALALGFLVWLVFTRDGDSDNGGGPKSSGATLSQLRSLPDEAGHPVYWAGEQPGVTYELTRTNRGEIYIRYLPQGVPVGDERPNYLTVGTYEFRNAYATLRKSARQDGTTSGTLPNRGIYVVNRDRPNSVYLAHRGQDLQIEVYAPSGRRAREVVTSGRVEPLR